MTLSELEELQERLEKLKASRGKVDENERQSTMRTTRKRIRRLKKNIASKSRKALSISGDGHEEVSLEAEEKPPTKKVKRKRKKKRSKRAIHENKLVIFSPDEKEDYLDQLTNLFKDLVAWSHPRVLGEAVGYGYSGSLIIDEAERWAYTPEIMATAIIEKYKQRWKDVEPEWFTVWSQGPIPIFCFGPVPDTTNIW